MRKATKKIISFLLCAAFVLSIAPIAPWQGGTTASAATGSTYKYVFANRTAASGGSQITPNDAEWKFVRTDDYYGKDITIKPSASSALTLESTGLWGTYGSTTRKFMQIYVPEAGMYSLTFECNGDSYSSSVQVLASADAYSWTVDANKIGDIPKTTSSGYFEAKMTEEITVTEPGYWTIIFYEPATPDGNRVVLDNLVLTKTAELIENGYRYNLAGASSAAIAGTGYAGSKTDAYNSEWKVGNKSAQISISADGNYLNIASLSGYKLGESAARQVALHVYVPDAGKYSIGFTYGGDTDNAKINVYAKEGEIAGEDSVKGIITGAPDGNFETYKIGFIPKETTAGIYTASMDKNIEAPKAGYYTIVFWGGQDGKEANLKDLTLTRIIEKVDIENAETFGDVSAYITKDGDFVAFSGIDTTENYSEVGFYIKKDDGEFVKCAVADGLVYKEITVKWGEGENEKRTIAVSDFFTSAQPGEDAHIFFSGAALDGASTIKFYPYAVPVDGSQTLTGYTYTVTLP